MRADLKPTSAGNFCQLDGVELSVDAGRAFHVSQGNVIRLVPEPKHRLKYSKPVPSHRTGSEYQLAVDIGGGDVAVLAGNFNVAVASEHADITAAGGNYDRRFARDADVQIGRNRVVAGALRIGVQGDRIAADVDLRLGARD